VVRDANGFAVAYVYGRSTEDEAMEAKQMTMDEARRVASNIAKLPDMLNRGEWAYLRPNLENPRLTSPIEKRRLAPRRYHHQQQWCQD
jgi:hypothetical protein